MTGRKPEYIQDPLFPDSALTNPGKPETKPDDQRCACRRHGHGDGWARYRTHGGEYVERRCHNHPSNTDPGNGNDSTGRQP